MFKMVAVFLVLISVFIGLASVWIYRSEKVRRKMDRFGGPPSLPVIGNVHQLKRNAADFTQQLLEFFDKYGHLGAFRLLLTASYPVIFITRAEHAELLEFFDKYGHLGAFRLLLTASYPVIFITRAEHAEPFLASNTHLNKADLYGLLRPWLADGLLLSSGDKWKARRKLLTPAFHFKILHDFVSVFNEQARVLVGKLGKHADGRPYNVYTDITLCALDIICETAMGCSVNAQGNEHSEYVSSVCRVSEYLFTRTRSPWFWPDIVFRLLGPGRHCDSCLKTMHDFTEKVIRERQRAFSDGHGDAVTMQHLIEKDDSDYVMKNRLAFLDLLLCSTEGGTKLSFLDIREEVDTFMFEGHDTTAMAMNWALHLIGDNPDVQEKIHEELDRIFDGDGERDATMDDLQQMRYLECCIKEALRIYPSVLLFARSLTENAIIAGIELDAGTTVVVASSAIHRDPRYFPDPERYDPDRFLPENCEHRHPFAYIPFSAGSRNCIGQKFAMLEEKAVLSALFRNFTVTSVQTRKQLRPVMELIFRPGNGIVLKLTRRTKTRSGT